MERSAPTREENAAAFSDEDVVAAYRFRPPYPDTLIDRLLALPPGGARNVLELGCGTGDLCRTLAPRVEHVDAVDPAAAMLRAAKASSGGDAANITWTQALAEDFDYPRPYDLVLTAESIHWMDWDAVFPRLAGAMSSGGRLVWLTREEDAPWADDYRALIPAFSVVSDYRPLDFPTELERGGYWRIEGRDATPPVPFRQSVEHYIELQHSRSSFARYRIGEKKAAEFDAALRRMLEPYADDGVIEYAFSVPYAWGRPLAR
ncbi:MAG TPA: class I SAM-dependent methyltransferase [Dehalococcoidia bacterium]|jgi:SAM-dependent methyltransferase|nr:class I SAM-dependent methyltransferase [Dehalococcoidia bacterium]